MRGRRYGSGQAAAARGWECLGSGLGGHPHQPAYICRGAEAGGVGPPGDHCGHRATRRAGLLARPARARHHRALSCFVPGQNPSHGPARQATGCMANCSSLRCPGLLDMMLFPGCAVRGYCSDWDHQNATAFPCDSVTGNLDTFTDECKARLFGP